MASQSCTITAGCCSPLEVRVSIGDTVTWSSGDTGSYTVSPPPGVFSSNAAISVSPGNPGTSGTVQSAQGTTRHNYVVAPTCKSKVPPDILVDGSPITAASVVAKTVVAKKKTSKKAAPKKAAAKKAPVKKIAPKKAAPKKAAVKKAAVKKAAPKKAAPKKAAPKKMAVKKAAVKKAPAKKKR